MAADLAAYYGRRAAEYEAIYARPDPVRQAEQAALAAALRTLVAGRRVLEVACGTGYWTAQYAATARHVVAVDVALEVLAIAEAKGLPPDRVTWAQADAYSLAVVPGDFDAAVAAFWFSHVPRARVGEFLRGLHARLAPGSRVLLADNVHVPGVGGDVVQLPGSLDTFKRRTLADGSRHDVLKNYYSAAELHAIFAPLGIVPVVETGACFWWLTYQTL
ncbi:MAG TPA: class I SAM-dependent methyltransferase [Chloroflexia bacterium]|nr:class I SAM-dependent methyltransferase [Chloroflexia bacterium]